MANQLGTNVIWTNQGITQTAVSASVVSVTFKKQSELKEVTDGSNNFLGVGKGKNKNMATFHCVMQTSGSNAVLPNVLDTFSVANPYCSGMAGTWYVSGEPTFDWKADDFAAFDLEGTQWLNSSGTALS